MTISISTICPFDDNETCIFQDCRPCDVRIETLMHIKDELEDIESHHLQEMIYQNGRIAKLTKARKGFTCRHCGAPIFHGSYYYQVTWAGAGLGDIKFPDRVCVRCVRDFIGGIA